jgi:hypothetical protein
MRPVLSVAALGALLLPCSPSAGDEIPVGERGALKVSGAQKDYLTHEPILLTASLETADPKWWLPPGPGKNLRGIIHFEVTPAVKERPGARALPFESDIPAGGVRVYDLLECLEFPAQGTFTVHLLLEHGGRRLKSNPITLAIRRPAKGDPEQGAVDRLHHLPWSNYIDNAFCGDTFDLVKTWPKSRLVKYAHFWNGLHSMHKKEYDKAIKSFQVVATEYPDFVLAVHARLAIVRCQRALAATDAKR